MDKNRQDIAGNYLKRDDIRGIYPAVLNISSAYAIGYATCRLLQSQGHSEPVIVIGHDCRHGNREITGAFSQGFQSAGGRSVCIGLVSTEHVYYACGVYASLYTAGAMVTASHNPKEYNGIKMLHSACVPFSTEELKAIGQMADGFRDAAGFKAKSVYPQLNPIDFDEYARHLVKLSGLDKKPDSPVPVFKVLVLAGNGMGAVAFEPITKLLKSKGLEAVILEGQPDGEFPNGVPNPLLPDFMKRLSQQTVLYNADLGIGFDGDADRAGFVDAQGNEIIPSQVLSLIAQQKLLDCNQDRPVIMRNLCCSQLLKHLFPADGSVELMDTPVGHGRIKQLMRCPALMKRTVFAGEHSGHYFFPEFNYVDSGVLTSLNMIKYAWHLKDEGKSLPAIINQWRKNYSWSGEINFEVETIEKLISLLKEINKMYSGAEVKRHEVVVDSELGQQRLVLAQGEYIPENLPSMDLKLMVDHGANGWWFVLRPSGNEPKLRLNVEAWGGNAQHVCHDLTQKLISSILDLGAKRT